MVAQHRQRDPDGEHRAETGAGAGEFHSVSLLSLYASSFFFCGPSLKLYTGNFRVVVAFTWGWLPNTQIHKTRAPILSAMAWWAAPELNRRRSARAMPGDLALLPARIKPAEAKRRSECHGGPAFPAADQLTHPELTGCFLRVSLAGSCAGLGREALPKLHRSRRGKAESRRSCCLRAAAFSGKGKSLQAPCRNCTGAVN